MAGEHHILIAAYSDSGHSMARLLNPNEPGPFQYDYGQVLRLDGFDNLPFAFEMHFGVGNGKSVPVIGQGNEVEVPDMCLLRHGTITAWLYLHDAETDGETRYTIEIPVKPRSEVTHEEPTPVQQSEIEQLIAALNAAVEESETNATHYPVIQDRMWMVWDAEQEQYVSSGIAATGPKGDKGDPGDKGDTGNGIHSTVLNPDYTLTITFTDGTTYTTPSIRGEKGDPGEESVMVATQVTGNQYRLGLGRE